MWWDIGEGGRASRSVWTHLWVTRRVDTGPEIGHLQSLGRISSETERKLESFMATRGQQIVSNGEARLEAGETCPRVFLDSTQPGGAEVAEANGPTQSGHGGSPIQPLPALQETRLREGGGHPVSQPMAEPSSRLPLRGCLMRAV